MFDYDSLPHIGHKHAVISIYQTIAQRDAHEHLFGCLVEGIVFIKEGENAQSEKSSYQITE
jgi:hypothetical protein